MYLTGSKRRDQNITYEGTPDAVKKSTIICSTLVQCQKNKNCTRFCHALFPEHKTWPIESPYECLHCGEYFDSVPMFRPRRQSFAKYGEDDLEYFDNFCRVGCVLGYIKEHPHSVNATEITDLIVILQEHFGLNGPFKPCPPRRFLKKFGGKYTLEEFYTTPMYYSTADQIMPPFQSLSICAEVNTIEKAQEYLRENLATTSNQSNIYNIDSDGAIKLTIGQNENVDHNQNKQHFDTISNSYELHLEALPQNVKEAVTLIESPECPTEISDENSNKIWTVRGLRIPNTASKDDELTASFYANCTHEKSKFDEYMNSVQKLKTVIDNNSNNNNDSALLKNHKKKKKKILNKKQNTNNKKKRKHNSVFSNIINNGTSIKKKQRLE